MCNLCRNKIYAEDNVYVSDISTKMLVCTTKITELYICKIIIKKQINETLNDRV